MAKLTAAERNKLPSSEFAGPAEKAKIRAKVHKKYPSIGKSGSVMGHLNDGDGHHAHHGTHEGDGHHASTHHGGHQHVNVHLHFGGKKKFSL